MRDLFRFGFSHHQDWTIETNRFDFHQFFWMFRGFEESRSQVFLMRVNGEDG
jgi:hypothetical protein